MNSYWVSCKVLYKKAKSRSKTLATVFMRKYVEIHEKRLSKTIPRPSTPPTSYPENAVLREANPKTYLYVSFTARTLDLHESPPFQLQIWPQFTLANEANLANIWDS